MISTQSRIPSLIAASLAGLLALAACKGGESQTQAPQEEDPFAGMAGEFASDKATLVIKEIESGSMGPRLDFQFAYENKDGSGTLFGSADMRDINQFEHEYKSETTHKVHFSFENRTWTVKHTVEGAKRKNEFNYSGIYAFKGPASE